GVRMLFSKNGRRDQAAAAAVVVAIGWQADTTALNLSGAGVGLDRREFVQVDAYLQTTAPPVFAAGDATGRLWLVPPAAPDASVAATTAVRGPPLPVGDAFNPIGSFTDPESAQVGLTEAQARAAHDVVVSIVPFADLPRPIIDGRTVGFCKLIG